MDALVIVIKDVDLVIVGETKMGFKMPMDSSSIKHQLHMAGVEVNSVYNDGFTQFGIKQELYKIKFLLDAIMKDSPTFAGEEEFLAEESKKEVWRTLKK